MSTNPFGDPDEEEIEQKPQLPTVAPSPSTTVLPFVRVPILLTCTALVFVLMVAGTATTALSFPPRKAEPSINGDYRLLGPLLLTAGCFLFVVNVALCAVLTREAYYSSRLIQPSSSAWNGQRPVPVSLVGGPFYIASTGPPLPTVPIPPFHASPWVYPNAPMEEYPMGCQKAAVSRPATATITRTQQPPYNPEIDLSIDGA